MYTNQNTDSDIMDEMKKSRKSQIISIAILLILIIGYSLWRNNGSDTMKLEWSESSLTITEPSGNIYSLPLKNIERISYHENWDFGTCGEASSSGFYRWGSCENAEGSYRLYASRNCKSVILLETAAERTAISYESDSITKELYKSIIPMLEEFGYHPEYDELAEESK